MSMLFDTSVVLEAPPESGMSDMEFTLAIGISCVVQASCGVEPVFYDRVIFTKQNPNRKPLIKSGSRRDFVERFAMQELGVTRNGFRKALRIAMRHGLVGKVTSGAETLLVPSCDSSVSHDDYLLLHQRAAKTVENAATWSNHLLGTLDYATV